jgi:hypothetical protein
MTITVNSRSPNTAGKYREDIYDIASGWADGDTIRTRFKRIVEANWTFTDASTVAADSVAIEVLQADSTVPREWATVVLQLAGTARAGRLSIKGY